MAGGSLDVINVHFFQLVSAMGWGDGGGGVEYGRVIEYTNLLSFELIYFRPLIAMFHDLVGFTVVLYED